MRKIALITAVFVVFSVCGCFLHDNKAFKQAVAINSEEAYNDYLEKYPDGRHIEEAKNCIDELIFANAKKENSFQSYEKYLAHPYALKYQKEARNLMKNCAINDSLQLYREAKNKAVEYEKARNWREALHFWQIASKAVNQDYLDESPELKACVNESEKHMKICFDVLQNPATISGEKVTIGYNWTSLKDDTTINNRKVERISLKGKITNNCPFAISDIRLSCNLYRETVLTINTVTGEDVSRGGDNLLGGIKKVIFVDNPLRPGETRSFHVSGRVSINFGKVLGANGGKQEFYMPDPAYDIEILSYKAK